MASPQELEAIVNSWQREPIRLQHPKQATFLEVLYQHSRDHSQVQMETIVNQPAFTLGSAWGIAKELHSFEYIYLLRDQQICRLRYNGLLTIKSEYEVLSAVVLTLHRIHTENHYDRIGLPTISRESDIRSFPAARECLAVLKAKNIINDSVEPGKFFAWLTQLGMELAVYLSQQSTGIIHGGT